MLSLTCRPNGGFFDSLTLTSPSAYQVFQRSGSTGSIVISGTYTGSPTAIEARWNGGSWTTITKGAGTFSGTLSGQAQGQGALEVRFTNDTSVSASAVNVGIGDIFVIAGQSNASGRGTSNQVYSHATLKAGIFKNNYQWAQLADPTDSNTGQVDTVSQEGTAQGGSVWPLLATSFMADQAVPVSFVPTAKGGTPITDWLPGANHQDRTTLYGSMVYRALQVGGVKAVLWWQGETDVVAGMSQATYNGHLDTIANAVQADLGVKLIATKLQDLSAYLTGYNEATINAAIGEAWGDNANVLAGPDLSDITPVGDGLHIANDAQLSIVAGRWWTALEGAFY